jgi:ribonuclease BN (tRNA processing enzyme)
VAEKADTTDTRPLVVGGDKPQTKEEIQAKIDNFEPLCALSQEMRAMLRQKMNIDQILAIEVDHCPQSYACLLYAKQNFGPGNKIIYSGDTQPVQNFINYAQGASLMIHEATLGVGNEEKANARKHTTTQQVMDLVDQI